MAALGGALARSVMKSSQGSLAVRMAFAAAQAVPQKALDLPLIGPLWDTLMRWAKPQAARLRRWRCSSRRPKRW